VFSWSIIDEAKNLVAQYDNVTLLLRPSDSVFLFRGEFVQNKQSQYQEIGNEEKTGGFEDGYVIPSAENKTLSRFYTNLISYFPKGDEENSVKEYLGEENLRVNEVLNDFWVPDRNVSASLGIGNYTAIFQILENGTIVHNEKNVTFAVVEVPFR